MTAYMVDPPAGWRHGFPKRCPEDVWGDQTKLRDWLVAEGYPEQGVDFAMKHLRVWEAA